MKNIFIQLKAKNILKKEPLLKLLDIDPEEENLPDHIDSYFDQDEHSVEDNIKFIFTLIEKHPENVIKEKLYAMLVFWASRAQSESINKIVESVEKSKENISTKVRLYDSLYAVFPCFTKAQKITNSRKNFCSARSTSFNKKTKSLFSAILLKILIIWSPRWPLITTNMLIFIWSLSTISKSTLSSIFLFIKQKCLETLHCEMFGRR